MNGADDIESCSVQASDGDGNTMTGTGSLDRSYGGPNQARCVYISINSSTPGFQVFEELNIQLTVTDEIGQSQTNTTTDVLPNREPTVSLDQPLDNVSVENPVTFEWTTSDIDNDQVESTLLVSNTSDMNDIKVNETITGTSFEAPNLEAEDYYWKVKADDSYEVIESSQRVFTIPESLENVSITLKGDYSEVVADGQERSISQGTSKVYKELDYPYIAMQSDSALEGIVPMNGYKRATYYNGAGHDEISVRKGLNGERFVLPANTGSTTDIEDREQVITAGEFFDLSSPSFTQDIDPEHTISALLMHEQINLTGDEGVIEPGSSVDLSIRNAGETGGMIEVEITTQ